MNNPPAFPHFGHTGWSNSGGMSLRDYFAAKAMEAFLMRPGSMTAPNDIIAQVAYNTADAMLAEREKS
jgi:hypothetical protein